MIERSSLVGLDESESSLSVTLTDSIITHINSPSLVDFIKIIPSIHIKNYGGIGGLKTISVRGLGSQHTGVLVNGILLNDQRSGQIDLSVISPRTITKMNFSIGVHPNFIPSAKSLIFNSLLYFEEKPSVRLKEDSLSLIIGSGIGSFGTYQPFFSVLKKIDEGKSITLDYEALLTKGNYPYSYQNGIETISKTRDNSEMSRHVLKFNYQNTSKKGQILSWYRHQNQNIPSVVITNNTHSDESTKTNQFVLNGLKRYTYESYDFKLSGGLNFSESAYKDPNYLNQKGGLDRSFQETNATASIGVSKEIMNLLCFFVHDFEYGHFKSNVISESVDRLGNFMALGTVFDQGRLKVDGNIVYSLIYDSGLPNKITSVINGMAGANYLFINTERTKTYLKLNYKSSFRMPSFNDLYYNNIGNKNLKHETSNQINFGLSNRFDLNGKILNQAIVSFNSFYGQLENKIIAVPTQNLYVWSMQNIAKVHNYGFDGSIKLTSTQIGKFITGIDAVYTLQYVKDFSDKSESFYGDQIRYTPYNLINFDLWLSVAALKVNWNMQFIGHQFYLPENTHENLIKEVALQDLTVSYSIKKKDRWSYDLKLSARNICNVQYELVRGFPMQGRSYWASFQVVI